VAEAEGLKWNPTELDRGDRSLWPRPAVPKSDDYRAALRRVVRIRHWPVISCDARRSTCSSTLIVPVDADGNEIEGSGLLPERDDPEDDPDRRRVSR
jgi:hypothetical protein